jgi:hypothetical protein
MARIQVILNDETEEKLRLYINKKYPKKPYGKISEVINEALDKYLAEATIDSS